MHPKQTVVTNQRRGPKASGGSAWAWGPARS